MARRLLYLPDKPIRLDKKIFSFMIASGQMSGMNYRQMRRSKGEYMPVSGIVLTCVAAKTSDIALQLATVAGVEVHGVLPDGRIVAVIDAETVDDEVALVTELQEIEDVISVHVAYHNFEDLGAEQP
jgi:nitrate reductase NapD